MFARPLAVRTRNNSARSRDGGVILPPITMKSKEPAIVKPLGEPVIGPDPDEPSFVWLAGQGGNGVMGAPAAAQLAAAAVLGERIPAKLASFGVTAQLT